jgi:ribosomal protein S18 acetylase RimI-like enzyme
MPEKLTVRPTVPGDSPTLIAIARDTGVFKPIEIQALEEVLDDYHATYRDQGHLSVTGEREGQIVGFAYYAPAAMTDRTWYLYWIAVTKQIQARGLGAKLLAHVENDIRLRHGRMLLLETSSTPHYDLTRKFYLKHHYQEQARIADFYAAGDSMVVYGKRFEG